MIEFIVGEMMAAKLKIPSASKLFGNVHVSASTMRVTVKLKSSQKCDSNILNID